MSLTDLYIAATVAHVPERQREEIGADLRAAIQDGIDARVDADATPATAEAAVLEELGDPERLAATYVDRHLFLIGPRLFLHWKRLTILLLSIILPIIAVLIPVGMWLGDDAEHVGDYIGTTLGGTLTVGVHLVFWVTLVFAVLERAGSGPEDWAEPWTVDRLKESPDVRVSGVETGFALATLAITAALLVWQQVWPWASTDAGEGLPLLNPDLWAFMLPALLAVMAVEAVAVVVRQVRGRWTMGDWWLTLALDVATVALIAVPVIQHDFLNRALFAEIGWPDAATTITLEQAEWTVLLVVAAICIADAWGSLNRARRSRRG